MIECKNCKTKFSGKFCTNCGQKEYSTKDKSIKHIIEEIFHFFTHFEGTFFTTLKSVLFHPGKLSIDYCNGIRKKYYKPISFYFIIVIIYLLFPIFQGLNSDLQSIRGNNFAGAGKYISWQIEKKLEKEHITEAELAEKYKEKSSKISKFLLFLLIPLSVALVYFLYFRHKKFAFDYFIIATEINIFFLLVSFVLLPIFIMLLSAIFKINIQDSVLVFISTIYFGIYTIMFFRKIFTEKWIYTVIKGSVFAFLHLIIVTMIYRLIVFEITFALI